MPMSSRWPMSVLSVRRRRRASLSVTSTRCVANTLSSTLCRSSSPTALALAAHDGDQLVEQPALGDQRVGERVDRRHDGARGGNEVDLLFGSVAHRGSDRG